MRAQPKILIITLYTEENELEECIASIKNQNYKNWDHEILEKLPNKLAHDTLYNRFMSKANEYDLFLKLDADMVFMDETALEKVVAVFAADEELDHVQFALKDWYTDSLMMGLHVYSNRVKWGIQQDTMFVDYRPQMPGRRKDVFDYPAPFADHSPNPSPFQAYMFGVHRASKVVQYDRLLINQSDARSQWRVLTQVWKHYTKCHDRRLAYVLLGSEDVLSKNTGHKHYDYTNRVSLQERFNQHESKSDVEIEIFLSPLWSNSKWVKFRWARKMFLRDKFSNIAKKFGYTYKK